MLSHVVAHQARAVLHLQAAHQAADHLTQVVRLAIQVAHLAAAHLTLHHSSVAHQAVQAARLTLHLSSVARQAVRTAQALSRRSSAARQAVRTALAAQARTAQALYHHSSAVRQAAPTAQAVLAQAARQQQLLHQAVLLLQLQAAVRDRARHVWQLLHHAAHLHRHQILLLVTDRQQLQAAAIHL